MEGHPMKRVVTLLLAAGLVFALAAPVAATPPSSDPKTDAQDAAAWLASQVTAAGFLQNPFAPGTASPSLTAQAIPAFVAAGVGQTKIDAMLAYLGAHVEDAVASGGVDNPGSLAYLILAATAAGADPTSFGTTHTNLVARLQATQRVSGPSSGLFGAADPTFDGAFRQGLALLALHAAGASNANGVTWLQQQQCPDGSWAEFRTDASGCVVDLSAFTGPDTNATALAVLGLHAQGADAAAGTAALSNVRNSGGGWGFFALSSQATDANSTGLVLEALRTVNGTADAPGIAALLTLQVGCTADPADRGGIAFQPGNGGTLVPDASATAQAIPALAEVALPVAAGSVAAGVPTPCAAPVTTTTTTTPVVVTGSTTTTSVPPVVIVDPTVPVTPTANQLPRTGSSSAPLVAFALLLVAVGAVFLRGARGRRT
jgi:LPXTG-motif cell wall-anchored protein